MGYEGYAVDEILVGFLKEIQTNHNIRNEKTKAIFLEHLSQCNEQLENGASDMPLIDLFTTIYYVNNLVFWFCDEFISYLFKDTCVDLKILYKSNMG